MASWCQSQVHAIALDSCFTEMAKTAGGIAGARDACVASGGFLAAPYTQEAFDAICDLASRSSQSVCGAALLLSSCDLWQDCRLTM